MFTRTWNRAFPDGISFLTLRSALEIAVFALATALAAQISVPIPGNPIPVTFQTAVVLLAGLRLGATRGALSQALYVFSYVLLGDGTLWGPTSGYLIGFVPAAALAGYLSPLARSFVSTWMVVFIASLVVFVPGAVWLKYFLGPATSWKMAFQIGVLPFLLGDVLKVTLTSVAWRRLVRTSF